MGGKLQGGPMLVAQDPLFADHIVKLVGIYGRAFVHASIIVMFFKFSSAWGKNTAILGEHPKWRQATGGIYRTSAFTENCWLNLF
ncbi:hypothetical protein ACFL9U_01235 [Thermodesulfobacteriota bacterium]